MTIEERYITETGGSLYKDEDGRIYPYIFRCDDDLDCYNLKYDDKRVSFLISDDKELSEDLVEDNQFYLLRDSVL